MSTESKSLQSQLDELNNNQKRMKADLDDVVTGTTAIAAGVTSLAATAASLAAANKTLQEQLAGASLTAEQSAALQAAVDASTALTTEADTLKANTDAVVASLPPQTPNPPQTGSGS